jgi:DHA1 family tetracycline resistance protein-like MFS transporter
MNIWQFNAAVFLKDVFLWGPTFIGGVFFLVGVCGILSRVILLPRLLKRWSEKTIGSIGLAGLTTGTALIFLSAFFPSPALFLPAVVCIVLGEGLFDPSYNARLSLSVDDGKQSQLQGTNALYHMLMPLGAAAVYTYSHGGIFAIASVLFCIGLVLFFQLKTKAQYAA